MADRAVGRLKRAGGLVWQTLVEFMRDGCPQMAAALAFYTMFSLPPLLLMLMLLTRPFLDPQAVANALREQLGPLLGPEGADQVQALIRNVTPPDGGGAAARVFGVLAFLFGATAGFAQLQNALNAAWQVGPDPTRGDIGNFLMKRVLSFAMILGIGFLLLVSLVVAAVMAAFGDVLSTIAPLWASRALLQILSEGLSFSVTALLFVSMYRFLPDAVVAWRDALFGGVATAVLFTVGRLLIGLYLGQSDPGSAYGAAGSLALVLLWVYYSSLTLLLGAELTQVWARRRGRTIVPEPGAVRIVRTQERVVGRGDKVEGTGNR